MIPFLDAREVNQCLGFSMLTDALSVAFTETVESPARHVHLLNTESDSSLLLMPAWQPELNTGVKLVTVAPKNRDLPAVHAVYVLFDSRTGAPLALMDGEALTLRRTAAASALASRYLSRADSKHLLLVGNGTLAPHLAVAHCLTRPIERITIWGRSTDKSRQCAELIRAHPEFPAHIELEISENLDQACGAADIISAGTTSQVPLIKGAALRPGSHIDLVGGFRPHMREADDEVMANATVFVDTFAAAVSEAGDLVQPLANGTLKREAIVAELADLCSGRHSGRTHAAEITVFKSVGAALEDLCAANLVWQQYQLRAAS